MTYSDVIVKRRGEPAPADPLLSQLASLTAGGHRFAHLAATALSEVVRDEVRADEAPLVAAIEARRLELEQSEEEISYLDFGAADRDGGQTPQEMYAGVGRSRTVSDLCRRTSKPYRSGLLLLKLLRLTGRRSCLELGTCLGISAAYQAAALEINGAGRLVTLEGAAPVAEIARQTLDRLGHGRVTLEVGRFQDILGPVVERYQPFDYAFIDGHHEERATLEYFDVVLPGLTDEALVVFDDIRWSDGMLRAWQSILAHPRVAISLDVVDIGLVWLAPSPGGAEHYRLE